MGVYLGNEKISPGDAPLVSVNPSGDDGEDLTRISINGENFNIDGQPGTTVVANPGGEDLTALSSIRLGNTSYGLTGGTEVQVNSVGKTTVNFASSTGAGGITVSESEGDVYMFVNSSTGSNTNASEKQVLVSNGNGGVSWEDQVDATTTGTWTPSSVGLETDDDTDDFSNIDCGWIRRNEEVVLYGKIGIPSNSASVDLEISPTSLPFTPIFGTLFGNDQGFVVNSSGTNQNSPTSNVSASGGWEEGYGSGGFTGVTAKGLQYDDISGYTLWFSFQYLTNDE